MAKESKSKDSKEKDSFSAGSLMSKDSAFAGGSLGGFGSFSGSSSFGQDVGGFSGNTSGVNVREANVSRNTGSNTATTTRDTYGLLDSTSMYDRGDLMQDFNASKAEREGRDVLSSGQTVSSRGDLLGSGGPMGLADAIGVQTQDAYADPTGFGRLATDRASTFGPANTLGLGLGSSVGSSLSGDMARWANSIAAIESRGSGNYSALGPVTRSGDRAYGRYQVMGNNIPSWTEQALGKRMTPQEFLKNPAAQDAVFAHHFGKSVQRYGNPQDAASVWFTGRPQSQGANRKDVLGTSGSGYVSKFNAALRQQGGDLSQELDVALYPTGTQVAAIDKPGSAFSTATDTQVPTQVASAEPVTQTRSDPVQRLNDKYLASYAMPDAMAAYAGQDAIRGAMNIGGPDLQGAGRDLQAYLTREQLPQDEGSLIAARPVQTASITGVRPDTIPGSVASPVAAGVTPSAEGLSSTGRTAIELGADAAVGMIPGVGIVNTAAGLMGLGSAGSFLADNIDYSLKNPDPNSRPTSLADALSNRESRDTFPTYVSPTEKTAETKTETKDPIKRLEVSYLSPFPLPSDRFGPNASLYR